ncbi:MAG: amidohydrolase family protein, partial [Ginsengibacter sp.]
TFAQKMNYSNYDLAMSNPEQIGSLLDVKHLSDAPFIGLYKNSFNAPAMMNRLSHDDSVRMVNLKKMIDGGVTIVAGTDAGNIGTQHATSFYDELLAMKQSGLTNWQIIESATINPTKILNHQDSMGSITVGKKADMVLLNANPVDSLENIININLVINKGHVINPDNLITITPEMLVQQQLNAYNYRSIDAFVAPYSDDVEMYQFPDKLIGKGKDAMRKAYSAIFNKFPDLHCEIKSRLIQGNWIIDKELVSGMGKTRVEATSIYQVENNRIQKIYFIL